MQPGFFHTNPCRDFSIQYFLLRWQIWYTQVPESAPGWNLDVHATDFIVFLKKLDRGCECISCTILKIITLRH